MSYGNIKPRAVLGTADHLTVDNCEFLGMEISDNHADFEFKQPNEAIVKHRLFHNDGTKAQQGITDWVTHLATTFIPIAEFTSAIEKSEDFRSFMSSVKKAIGNNHLGIKVNILFMPNAKGFVSLPKFGEFIELASMPRTIKVSEYNYKAIVKGFPMPDKESEKEPMDFLNSQSFPSVN